MQWLIVGLVGLGVAAIGSVLEGKLGTDGDKKSSAPRKRETAAEAFARGKLEAEAESKSKADAEAAKQKEIDAAVKRAMKNNRGVPKVKEETE